MALFDSSAGSTCPHADQHRTKMLQLVKKPIKKKHGSHIQTADMSCIPQKYPHSSDVFPSQIRSGRSWPRCLSKMASPRVPRTALGDAFSSNILREGYTSFYIMPQYSCNASAFIQIYYYTHVLYIYILYIYIYVYIHMMSFMKQAHFGHTLAFVGVARVSQETKRTNH